MESQMPPDALSRGRRIITFAANLICSSYSFLSKLTRPNGDANFPFSRTSPHVAAPTARSRSSPPRPSNSPPSSHKTSTRAPFMLVGASGKRRRSYCLRRSSVQHMGCWMPVQYQPGFEELVQDSTAAAPCAATCSHMPARNCKTRDAMAWVPATYRPGFEELSDREPREFFTADEELPPVRFGSDRVVAGIRKRQEQGCKFPLRRNLFVRARNGGRMERRTETKLRWLLVNPIPGLPSVLPQPLSMRDCKLAGHTILEVDSDNGRRWTLSISSEELDRFLSDHRGRSWREGSGKVMGGKGEHSPFESCRAGSDVV